MSEKGIRETYELGETFRELGIKVEGLYTSAFKRSL